MTTQTLPQITTNGQECEGVVIAGVPVGLTAEDGRYHLRHLMVGDYTIDMAQELLRPAANVAVKALRNGATGPEAAIAAIYGVDHGDEYLPYCIANTTMGKCPDGCCGYGADMDHTPVTEALENASKAYHAARKLGEAS